MALILPFSGDLWYIILSVSCHSGLHRVTRGRIGAINVLNSCYIRTYKGLVSRE
jgi:hypothetical protein